MYWNIHTLCYITFLCLVFLFIGTFVLPKSTYANTGIISSTNRYAWNENVGWIDFGSSNGNVVLTDEKFTGYAWGENIGWISLNCENTNSCSTSDYGVTNTSTGTLGGTAWGENVGWIFFAPDNGGITIDENGIFSGYAWGENIGWIVFNCSTTDSCTTANYFVETTWRPDMDTIDPIDNRPTGRRNFQTPRPTIQNTTVTNTISSEPLQRPQNGFSLFLNNNTSYSTTSALTVTIEGGNATQMALSFRPDFADTTLVPYQRQSRINACTTAPCYAGDYTLYGIVYDSLGNSSPILSDTIALRASDNPLENNSIEKEIFDIPEEHIFYFLKDLRPGDTHEDVAILQTFLNTTRCPIAISGAGSPGHETTYFGGQTYRALQCYQTQHAITQDTVGYLGPATRDHIHKTTTLVIRNTIHLTSVSRETSLSYPLFLGMSGPTVNALQMLLANYPDYYPEALITGYFGSLTQQAIGRIQESFNIVGPQDYGYGYVGPKTYSILQELKK